MTMKKLIVLITAFVLGLILASCGGARDDKNEAEPYPTTDTTKKEKLNDPFADSTNKSQPENNEKVVD
ncbi:MAG: hypothetical protein K0S12_807 [Bacteroidetes bacterium]|jgi:hypothetical protein|nr:hypothetical protein [Bacteroidota bacterium]